MLIFRYLLKETLKSQLAIFFILMAIFVTLRFVRVLGDASDGDIPAGLVLGDSSLVRCLTAPAISVSPSGLISATSQLTRQGNPVNLRSVAALATTIGLFEQYFSQSNALGGHFHQFVFFDVLKCGFE
jgi:hypothetical protein